MRIVMDTNVLVSALLSPNGSPARVLALVMDGKVELCVDVRIFAEYEEVLNRSRFKFRRESIDKVLLFIKHETQWLMPTPVDIEMPDADDIPFYETALFADAYRLVTGNKVHFPDEDWIVLPAKFLEEYHKLRHDS